MSNVPSFGGVQRPVHALGRRFARLSPVSLIAMTALAACQLAMADMPRHAEARSKSAAAQLSQQHMLSAARAADASRETWQGKMYRDLITEHTRWFFSIPTDVSAGNPAETGANCGLNQDGPAWFLMGPSLPNFTVSCTVPAGKAIFMPALGYAYDFPCPAPYPQLSPGQSLQAFLSAMSAEFIDGISYAVMTVDNKPVKLRRAATGVFSFTAAKDWSNWDVCATGSPQLVQTDGLWALIEPPSVGKHTINLKLSHPALGTIDGTWILNVVR